jgi:MYXO-CTERM domain-containing protein
MLTSHSPGGQWFRALIVVVAAWMPALLMPARAEAHFRLIAPTNWMMMAADGSPQKLGPCGNEAPQTPTNAVTPFHPGDTVTIQLQETVFHPGHYRVALAVNSQSELPAEPTVTPAATPCGSVPIDMNPAFPVLVDGALQHMTALNGVQTITVKLPTNITCTKCTLQIIEFMSNHGLNMPGGCFYHHCANISIEAGDGGAPDAGRDASMGSGGQGGGGGSGSGGASNATGGAAGTSGSTGGASTGMGGAGVAGALGTAGTTSTTTNGSTSSTGSGAGGTPGTAGSGGTMPSGTDSGCSCSIPRGHGATLATFGALAAFFAAGARRRRRRS